MGSAPSETRETTRSTMPLPDMAILQSVLGKLEAAAVTFDALEAGNAAWNEADANRDFALARTALERVIELVRQCLS